MKRIVSLTVVLVSCFVIFMGCRENADTLEQSINMISLSAPGNEEYRQKAENAIAYHMRGFDGLDFADGTVMNDKQSGDVLLVDEAGNEKILLEGNHLPDEQSLNYEAKEALSSTAFIYNGITDRRVLRGIGFYDLQSGKNRFFPGVFSYEITSDGVFFFNELINWEPNPKDEIEFATPFFDPERFRLIRVDAEDYTETDLTDKYPQSSLEMANHFAVSSDGKAVALVSGDWEAYAVSVEIYSLENGRNLFSGEFADATELMVAGVSLGCMYYTFDSNELMLIFPEYFDDIPTVRPGDSALLTKY